MEVEIIVLLVFLLVVVFPLIFLLIDILRDEIRKANPLKIPRWRAIEKKLVNGDIKIVTEYNYFNNDKYWKEYTEHKTIESAKKEIEKEIEKDLKKYASRTSIKETIVLETKLIKLK